MTSNSVNIKDFRTEIPGALSADGTAWVFPPVLTTTSHGKESRWQIRVSVVKMPIADPPEFVPIVDEHYTSGILTGLAGWFKVDTGIDGTISKRAATIITTGKNIGKKSATNVFTQALRDALGLHNTQMKKASVRVANVGGPVVDTSTLYPPMLAQVYSAVYGKAWPCGPVSTTTVNLDGSEARDSVTMYIQPKYNGVRGVFMMTAVPDSNPPAYSIVMYSRRKNIYPGFAYIKAELSPILAAYYATGTQLYLDGELYKHGVALQDISGYARREDQPADVKLDFMLYDCYVANKPEMLYVDRKAILDTIFTTNALTYTKQVPTRPCSDYDTCMRIYNETLAGGYEGVMVRLNAPYRISYNEYHSAVLLKMKPTFDAELAVASYGVASKGKAAGALMIICWTEGTEAHPSTQFPVTPAMTIVDRVALATRMAEVEANGKTHFENHWLGRKIIVEYDELSKDNVPLRARTKLAVRTWD